MSMEAVKHFVSNCKDDKIPQQDQTPTTKARIDDFQWMRNQILTEYLAKNHKISQVIPCLIPFYVTESN